MQFSFRYILNILYLKIVDRCISNPTWSAFENFVVFQFRLMRLNLTHCTEHFVTRPALYQLFHMSLSMPIKDRSRFKLFITHFAYRNFTRRLLIKNEIYNKIYINILNVFDNKTDLPRGFSYAFSACQAL